MRLQEALRQKDMPGLPREYSRRPADHGDDYGNRSLLIISVVEAWDDSISDIFCSIFLLFTIRRSLLIDFVQSGEFVPE